jgi:hypothetical protein
VKKTVLLYGLVAGLLPTTVGCMAGDPGERWSGAVPLTRIAILAQEPEAGLPLAGIVSDGGAVRVDGGRVALLDYDLARIVILDTAGKVVVTMGRRGGGPGEIQNPRFLVRTRDGFGVYDDIKFALVTFDVHGRPQAELPQQALIGSPRGIVTGIARMDDGSWVYSTREKDGETYREALYSHTKDSTRELVATTPAPTRPIRLPCGIEMSGEAPVFTPTLRWSAQGMRVAYVAGAEDLVAIRDLAGGRSLTLGTGKPGPRANESEALDANIGLKVERGGVRCELTRAEAVRQRGMAERIPAIERIALAPDGTLWVSLRGDAGATTVHRRDTVSDEVIAPGPFPGLFLSTGRFITDEADTAGQASVSLWQVGRHP